MFYNVCMIGLKPIDLRDITNRSEFKAVKWLTVDKEIPITDLARTNGHGKPDFIYIPTEYGYEVKLLNRHHGAIFSERQYNNLRKMIGEVLVYRDEDVIYEPYAILPFADLPEPAQVMKCHGIDLYLSPSPDTYYLSIAMESSIKDEMETLRSEVEKRFGEQNGWGRMMIQAMYAVLCDTGLYRFTEALRVGVRYYVAHCPFCGEQMQLLPEGKDILYWFVQCTCGKKFVARRKVV